VSEFAVCVAVFGRFLMSEFAVCVGVGAGVSGGPG